MPWTVADVDRHKKGLSDAQKKTWVKVANSALKRCLGKGGSQDECEGSAIRQANSVAGNQKESGMEYKAYTMSTNNVLISVNAIDVGGEAVPVAELVAAYLEQQDEGDDADLGEAVWTTAFVNDLPDSSFALIEPGGEKDEEGKTKPRSLRHLPYKDSGGKVDVPHLRNALARLPQMKGVAAGLISKALKKLQAVAKKHLKTYQEEMEALDLAISLVESFEIEFDEGENETQLSEIGVAAAQEMAEADLCENATFDAFMPEGDHSAAILEVVEEAGIAAGEGRRAPVVVDLQIIRPGPGNKKDNRYYPPATLRNYAHVFENADIFVTDHQAGQRGEKTKVGRVRECPVRFTGVGGPVGRAVVYDPDTAEKIRNRADAAELHTLHCSIFGTGNIRPGKVDGKEYGIVESINNGPLVEFVSKAGAGGHALALAESDTGGVKMDKKQIEELLSESGLPQEAQERLAGAEYEDEKAVKEAILREKAQEQEAPQKLAEADVGKAVGETKLPEFAKAALKARSYADQAELKEAIEGAVREVAKLTGSGQPFGQGGGEAPGGAIVSEADVQARMDEIDRRHGLHVPERGQQ